MKQSGTDLIFILSEGLYEREEIVGVSLLSTLSGQAIFLTEKNNKSKKLIKTCDINSGNNFQDSRNGFKYGFASI